MAEKARYRPVNFALADVEVRETPAATYVSARAPLQRYADRTTDLLLHWAATAPDRSYMARKEEGAWRHLSYADALKSAQALGQALVERGLSAERPVLILSGNDLEHAQLALACQYAGVPYAPVSPAYSLQSGDYNKLRHVVNVLQPGLVFAADGAAFGPGIAAAIPADVELVLARGEVAGRKSTSFASLLATKPTPAVEAARQATGPDTIVKFLFTSGSTKLPKAVVTTQRMLCSNQQMLLQCWPFLAEEPPVLLDWLPWNHTFGGSKDVNLVLFNGGTLYIDDGKPTPQHIGITLQNLREVAPTIYFNVPKGWEEVAQALGRDPGLRRHYYSRLKLQFYAGAALSQPVWDQMHASAEAECGERIVMTTGLGMTETAPCALFVLSNEARAGELGTPCPGMEVKLVRDGDKTEIRYRGPNVTPGYWRAPEESAGMFDDEGFLCSGDAVKWRDPARPELGFVFDGRVAEDFKLNTGTWVSVGPLRERVIRAGAPYLQDVVVTGHDRGEIGLMIIPRLALCRELAALGEAATNAEVLDAPAVRGFFGALVQQMHDQGTGSATRVKRACLMHEVPNIDRGEITDKGSINQRAMLTHRAMLVQALYDGNAPFFIQPN
ncbi:feruloyl-CoA synthase [Massilia terrae]|uniref:Feruloyl-CoA synthase n=1 Tax=Massilia terrae TaxID=1811224 RepID=A0ABT2D312_9BURK|nr:feruloyl-CoA synthase [Massilia terrae]MCS0660639.1 feruloyl-CoA synthase [Massilia terrae]